MKVKQLFWGIHSFSLYLSVVFFLIFIITSTVKEIDFNAFFCLLSSLCAAIYISDLIKFIKSKSEEMYIKSKEYENANLYQWIADNNVSDKYINTLFNEQNIKYSEIMNNITIVKEKIKKECNEDPVNYELLKGYLEIKSDNKTRKKVIAVIVSLISTFPLTQIYEHFKGENLGNIISIVSNFEFNILIILISYVSFILIVCVEVYNVLTYKTRKIKYLISILDILIKNK